MQKTRVLVKSAFRHLPCVSTGLAVRWLSNLQAVSVVARRPKRCAKRSSPGAPKKGEGVVHIREVTLWDQVHVASRGYFLLAGLIHRSRWPERRTLIPGGQEVL